MPGALSRFRMLDLSRQLPGPFCSMLLADLGMDVLAVYAPTDPMGMGIPLLGRNKRSLTLNLKAPEGRAIFHRLAREADVVLEGSRPGAAARLGGDYETLRTQNPRLVYCSISGYGQDGPYRDRVGHDVNYLGFAGVIGLTGAAGGPPVIPGVQIADIGAGTLMAAVGILGALAARRPRHLLRPGGDARRDAARPAGAPPGHGGRPGWRPADAREPDQALGHAAHDPQPVARPRRAHGQRAREPRLLAGRHRGAARAGGGVVMPGVLAAAGYIPRYRLPRELIAREWGGQAAGGEKAVANHDEDSLTLAVSAALGLEGAGARPDAVFFATTTSPYTEKQGAATIAAVLDLPGATRTADFTDTLRAGTSAFLAGLATLAGGARRVLAAAGECRLGEPDSIVEQNYGDAGAAVLLGGGAGRAEVIATHSIADEFLGTWRTREQEFPRSFPGAFEAKYGYGRVLGEAVKGVLAKAEVSPEALATVILPTPSPRAPQTIVQALGLDAKRQLQDSFWTTVGDTGAAQPLLMLAAALERAKAGDLG